MEPPSVVTEYSDPGMPGSAGRADVLQPNWASLGWTVSSTMLPSTTRLATIRVVVDPAGTMFSSTIATGAPGGAVL
jgi:hypothetical protein